MPSESPRQLAGKRAEQQKPTAAKKRDPLTCMRNKAWCTMGGVE